MSYDFQTVTHGKWILAGEHAVIRGHGALVFPLQDKTLTLSYIKSPENSLKIQTDNIEGTNANISLLFTQILEHAKNILGQSELNVYGTFHVNNQVPAGMGLGASAALCVAIARWFVAHAFITSSQLYYFAKELEHLFHGQSSGLDIAAVSSSASIYFKAGQYTMLQPAWQPHWQLSSCGNISTTATCIHKVQQLWKENSTLAASIDHQMNDSVEKAKTAIEFYTDQSKDLLTEAINQAHDCFQQWGLIPDTLQAHIQRLRDDGALAVKPTGSGGGGTVVSLWD